MNLSLTLGTLYQCGVRLVRGVVKEAHPQKIVLSDGSDVPYGLLVWATGVGSSQFVKSLNLPKSPGGRDALLQYPYVSHFCLFNISFMTCNPVSDAII